MFNSFSSVPVSSQLRMDTTYASSDTARVAVGGEVDLATAEVLRDRLLNVLGGHPLGVLTVDLSGVTFLDCAGVSALVCLRNAAVQVDCQMWVTDPRPLVRRVLDLTGVLGILTAPTGQPRRVMTEPDYSTRAGLTTSNPTLCGLLVVVSQTGHRRG